MNQVLPDFPKQKAKLEQRLQILMDQKRVTELGPFGKSPAVSLAEGDRLIFEGEDGTESEMEFRHAEAEFKVSVDEIPTLTLDQLTAKMGKAVEDLARQQFEGAIAEVGRAVDKVGNTLYMGGEPLCEEHILRALERIAIEFDEAGQPQMPTLMTGPLLAERVKEVLALIDSQPHLRRRFDEVVSRKREEWRARESCRKLVG